MRGSSGRPSQTRVRASAKLERWARADANFCAPRADGTMAADGQPTMSAASAASAPSYPSSNRKQVDWDKVDKEVSEELEGEKLEGDAALNKLFQDIYGRADEVRTRPSVALGAH